MQSEERAVMSYVVSEGLDFLAHFVQSDWDLLYQLYRINECCIDKQRRPKSDRQSCMSVHI